MLAYTAHALATLVSWAEDQIQAAVREQKGALGA